MLKGLEARRLVSPPAGEGDGRSRPVELTQEGRDLVERAMPAVQVAEAPLLQADGASPAVALAKTTTG